MDQELYSELLAGNADSSICSSGRRVDVAYALTKWRQMTDRA